MSLFLVCRDTTAFHVGSCRGGRRSPVPGPCKSWGPIRGEKCVVSLLPSQHQGLWAIISGANISGPYTTDPEPLSWLCKWSASIPRRGSSGSLARCRRACGSSARWADLDPACVSDPVTQTIDSFVARNRCASIFPFQPHRSRTPNTN